MRPNLELQVDDFNSDSAEAAQISMVELFTSAPSSGSGVELNLIGVPGRTYIVQAVRTLVNSQWSAVGSVTAPAYLGRAQFDDASGAPNRLTD